MSSASLLPDLVSPHEAAVMKRVLDEEQAAREHVVVYLSGAHAYGFPSPDSDLDLKAIHVARTEDLLGLHVPPSTYDRAEVIDGVEIDYTSNEIAHALSGFLAGNGNFLERALGRTAPLRSRWLDGLADVARRALSRRAHRHYRGFAQSQWKLAEKEPTAKKLLYVLRTSLTGIHLLETGELEADLSRLMDGYGLSDAAVLIERKRSGERVSLAVPEMEAWRTRVGELFLRLDAARERSPLPEAPRNEAEVQAWLVDLRRSLL